MPATNIYIIRHGESEWNAVSRWQGAADPPLSDRGKEQAIYLAEHFPDLPVTRVFSSDQVRAHDTAKPLATRFNQSIELEPDLREIDVGSWSGFTRAEIAEREPGALDSYFQGKKGWQGGETYEQHEARAADMARKLDEVDDEHVIVMSHGGTIRALVLALLDFDKYHRWRLAGIDHTTITHIALGRFGYQLHSYGVKPIVGGELKAIS